MFRVILKIYTWWIVSRELAKIGNLKFVLVKIVVQINEIVVDINDFAPQSQEVISRVWIVVKFSWPRTDFFNISYSYISVEFISVDLQPRLFPGCSAKTMQHETFSFLFNLYKYMSLMYGTPEFLDARLWSLDASLRKLGSGH